MRRFTFLLLSFMSCTAATSTIGTRATSPSDICEISAAKGHVCNKAGKLATPQNLKSTQAEYLQECIDALHIADKAQSASFQDQTGNCTLYKATLAQQGYRQSSSPSLRFVDKACLQCRACSLGFINGDFETGELKPWGSVSYPFGGNEFVISQPGYKGSRYAAKSEQSQAGQPGNGVSALFTSVLVQNFEACFGTTYLIRAFVKGHFKASDTDNQHYLRMYINDQPGDTASTRLDRFQSSYQLVNITYTANEHYPQIVFSASMALNRNTSATFTVWIDTVSVIPQASLS